VSDDKVFALYGGLVRKSFEKAGFAAEHFIFPNGEASKNMDTVTKLLTFMADKGFTRGDLAVALGGGVTGDLCGFAASIYMRGLPYIQIPTTLLAAVDSSVGGKTGVDLGGGKNLAGAFYQPSAVFCDTGTFATLPREVFADGICEAVKYGCIADQALFSKILQNDIDTLRKSTRAELEEIVETCVKIKRDIVERDEYDTGERQLLNFGHTAGHAAEALSGYTISHGRAVAMGMSLMAGEKERSWLAQVFQKYDVDLRCPYTAKELAQKALSDKKRKGGMITVVLISEIGKGYLRQIAASGLEDCFAKGMGV
jgi:3-dehydroquinate synthase